MKTKTKSYELSDKINNGRWLSTRVSAAFWDSLNARYDNDLEDLLLWAKEMNMANCGWQEYRLKEVLIKSIGDILNHRKKYSIKQEEMKGKKK